jgi:hypothetical protein
MPIILRKVIVSSKRIMPKITTNTGSVTDKMATFSAWILLSPSSISRIGIAVETTPKPMI